MDPYRTEIHIPLSDGLEKHFEIIVEKGESDNTVELDHVQLMACTHGMIA